MSAGLNSGSGESRLRTFAGGFIGDADAADGTRARRLGCRGSTRGRPGGAAIRRFFNQCVFSNDFRRGRCEEGYLGSLKHDGKHHTGERRGEAGEERGGEGRGGEERKGEKRRRRGGRKRRGRQREERR